MTLAESLDKCALYIVSLNSHSAESVARFRSMLKNDERAPLAELLKLLDYQGFVDTFCTTDRADRASLLASKGRVTDKKMQAFFLLELIAALRGSTFGYANFVWPLEFEASVTVRLKQLSKKRIEKSLNAVVDMYGNPNISLPIRAQLEPVLIKSLFDSTWNQWYLCLVRGLQTLLPMVACRNIRDGDDGIPMTETSTGMPVIIKHCLDRMHALGINSTDELLRSIKKKMLTNIHELKNITNIPLRHGSAKAQIQGRSSNMRRNIISPKVLSIRGQILLNPTLHANEIIIPANTLRRFRIHLNIHKTENYRLYDLSSVLPQPTCFYDLAPDCRLVMKRDPVLDLSSLVLITRVAFADSDLIHISPTILKGQNADFDGDAENINDFNGRLACAELDLCLGTACKITNGFFTLKLQFTETHIYFMHQRSLPKEHQFYELYETVKRLCIHAWLRCSTTVQLINQLLLEYDKYPPSECDVTLAEIVQMIEPTELILRTFCWQLYCKYGSFITDRFFHEINLKSIELYNGIKNDYYCAELDGSELMSANMKFNRTLLKTVFSLSKGTISHFLEFMNVYNAEAADLEDFPATAKQLQDKVDNATSQIAIAVRQIPIIGHQSFKGLITYNALYVRDGALYYNDICLQKNVNDYFFPQNVFANTTTALVFDALCKANSLPINQSAQSGE